MDKILESAGLERLTTPELESTNKVSENIGSGHYIAGLGEIGAPLTPSLSAHLPHDGLGTLNGIGENDPALLNDWSPNAMHADISPEWPWMELFATEMTSTNTLGGKPDFFTMK